MSQGSIPFCADANLARRLHEARDFMRQIFGLGRNAQHVDWTEVVHRIENGLTSKEIELAKAEHEEFSQDLLNRRLPHPIDELDYRLTKEYKAEIQKSLQDLLDQLEEKKAQREFAEIVANTHRMLHWRCIQTSFDLMRIFEPAELEKKIGPATMASELWDECRSVGSWLPWFENQADELVRRFATPSPLFRDYDLLQRVAVEWTKLAKKLGLAENKEGEPLGSQQIRREDIEYKMQELGIQLPPAIVELKDRLLNREKTPDLHEAMKRHVERVLRHRVRLTIDINNLPAVDAAISQFLYLCFWRIVKNAGEWLGLKPRRLIWSCYVFTHLPGDAKKAVNFAAPIRRPANFPQKSKPKAIGDASLISDPTREPPQQRVSTPLSGPRVEGPDLEDEQVRDSLLEWQRQTINALAEQTRSVMLLGIGNDPSTLQPRRPMNAVEIASELGLALGDVRRQIALGTKMLKQAAQNRHER